MPVVGFLSSNAAASPTSVSYILPAVRQGLKEAGYIEAQNLAIDYRWADGQYDSLPALAADLIGRKAAVILALDNTAAQAAKSASATVPIVFAIGGDPVNLGLVASMKEAGGNVTGARMSPARRCASKRLVRPRCSLT